MSELPPDVYEALHPGRSWPHGVLRVRCPWCKAPAGEMCSMDVGGDRRRTLSTPHPSRFDAAEIGYPVVSEGMRNVSEQENAQEGTSDD